MTPNPPNVSAGQLAHGPAVWLAPNIRLASHVYQLTPQDLQELDAALGRSVAGGRNPASIGRAQFPLAELATSLKEIRLQLEEGSGFYVVRGIPVERYGARELEILLCGIGAHLGRVMPQNADGDLLNHVRAAPGEPTRGYESGSALPFHSDSCDIVGLLCLRAAESGGESSIASAYAVHNALVHRRPDLLRTLCQPFYIDRHGERPPGAPPYYATPVFMWHEGRLFSRFNPGYLWSAQRYPETPRLTRQQVDAIEIFERLCRSDPFRLDMSLSPGELQLLNNNRLVHSRSAYADYPDPARRRHLLRIWLFTSEVDQVPGPMRERYRDMESWQMNARLPSRIGE